MFSLASSPFASIFLLSPFLSLGSIKLSEFHSFSLSPSIPSVCRSWANPSLMYSLVWNHLPFSPPIPQDLRQTSPNNILAYFISHRYNPWIHTVCRKKICGLSIKGYAHLFFLDTHTHREREIQTWERMNLILSPSSSSYCQFGYPSPHLHEWMREGPKGFSIIIQYHHIIINAFSLSRHTKREQATNLDTWELIHAPLHPHPHPSTICPAKGRGIGFGILAPRGS